MYGVLVSLWIVWGLYYIFGHNNEELILEFGKKEVDEFIWGSFFMTLLSSFYCILLDCIDRFPHNQTKYFAFFHALLLFSCCLWIGIPWYVALFTLCSYRLFISFGFHSKTFMYTTMISYGLILYGTTNQFQDSSLGFFLRFFFLNTVEAQEQAIAFSWLAIVIGIIAHVIKEGTPSIRFIRPAKRVKNTPSSPKPKPKPKDFNELF